MEIRTADDKRAAIEALLNEARIEANQLRMRIERYRGVIASTRLIMGHELKRPTTAICGYLELAREDVEKANCREALAYIDKARAEADLLAELNAFYLDLLRVDGATGEPNVNSVDVARVVDEAIAHVPEELRARARVRVSSDGNIPSVMINRNALKLIVINLVENALNYSPDDAPVRVEIEAAPDKRGVADGELLMIRVSDQGDGIAPDDIKRVFKPFVRLDEGKIDGTGLGLTLVRSLVDMCGGDISIRSQQHEGTTVNVTFPLSTDDRSAGVVSP
jgi:signal transduction histidine kinase